MSKVELFQGDNREILAGYPDNYFDSVVTDPPYGLTSITKRFSQTNLEDNNQTGENARNRSTPQARLARGFMGKEWDGSGIEYDVEFWHLVFQKLKPGAHLLAFGGTRTYHRIAIAIEDAGFEIWDQLQWIYGSGFPKSLNLKGEWEGWGTALKPANEPICLARKPKIGTVAGNVLEYGTGAINIDGCRIPTGEPIPVNRLESWSGFGQIKQPEYTREMNTMGRWPSNVILDEAAAVMLDEQTGENGSGNYRAPSARLRAAHKLIPSNGMSNAPDNYGDSGGASRFFYVAKANRGERNLGLWEVEPKQREMMSSLGQGILPKQTPHRNEPQRNHHPTVKPITLMRYLCKLITPPGGIILDPFMGSGSTGCGAVLEGFNFTGIDLDTEYVDIARRRIAFWSSRVQLSLFDQLNLIELEEHE